MKLIMNKDPRLTSVKISVLIPAHGACEFLPDAVNSVLAQNFPSDFEILIVTQNIPPSVLEFIHSLKIPEIRVVNDSGTGIVSALNLGLKISKYPWIARMDSDDLMAKDRIELQGRAIQRRRNVSIIGGQAIRIDSNGLELGHIRYPRSNFAIRYSLKYICAIAHPGVMMKKSVVMSAGGYRLETQLAEDFDLWTRLKSRKIRFLNIPETVLYYRSHSNQITSQGLKAHFEKESEVIFRNLRPNSESTKKELGALGKAAEHLGEQKLFEAVSDVEGDWKIRKLVYKYIFGRIICRVIYMSRL